MVFMLSIGPVRWATHGNGGRKLYGSGALFEVAFYRILPAAARSKEISQYNKQMDLSLESRA